MESQNSIHQDTRYNFWWRDYPNSNYRQSLEIHAKMGDVVDYDEWVRLFHALEMCRLETLRKIKRERYESA